MRASLVRMQGERRGDGHVQNGRGFVDSRRRVDQSRLATVTCRNALINLEFSNSGPPRRLCVTVLILL
jgi:hypothetical protein